MIVLVVCENERDLLRVVSGLHARPGIEVEQVRSAAEAHRRMDAGGVDVLVIDGDMRPEGGYSLLFEERGAGVLRGEPTPPAVILVEREQDRWLAQWAGAQETMLKPVDPFGLADLVVLLGETSTVT